MPLACSAATLRVSGLEHEQSHCEHEAQCSSITVSMGSEHCAPKCCIRTLPLDRHMEVCADKDWRRLWSLWQSCDEDSKQAQLHMLSV